MATRSGDIDASLITFLQRKKNLTPGQLDELLYEQSGLLGVSGISADIRQLLDSSDARARLAVDLYCYRARKYLGAYLAVLNGADAIIFGGGVGENIAVVRAKILDGMKWCGIELCADAHMALPALRHRVILNFEGEAERIDSDTILQAILDSTRE